MQRTVFRQQKRSVCKGRGTACMVGSLLCSALLFSSPAGHGGVAIEKAQLRLHSGTLMVSRLSRFLVLGQAFSLSRPFICRAIPRACPTLRLASRWTLPKPANADQGNSPDLASPHAALTSLFIHTAKHGKLLRQGESKLCWRRPYTGRFTCATTPANKQSKSCSAQNNFAWSDIRQRLRSEQ